jgi:Mrp family chromosome partitioning ATPase
MAAGVDQAARTAQVRTVVLTAVHPGAGTSSIVDSLGSTLAKLGRKTLVIDASGVRPPVAYLTVSLARSAQSERGFHRARPDVELQATPVVTESVTPKLTPLTGLWTRLSKMLRTNTTSF